MDDRLSMLTNIELEASFIYYIISLIYVIVSNDQKVDRT